MTRSDDTHENEANMTPEEMKNELRYLRAENAYPVSYTHLTLPTKA